MIIYIKIFVLATAIWLAMFMDRMSGIGTVGWALMLAWSVWIFFLPFVIDSMGYLLGRGSSKLK
jgi:hypothetical protein